MRVVLFLLCVMAFLAGCGVLLAATTAIHEIQAFMLFLISAVLLTGASVVEAINLARKRIEYCLHNPTDAKAVVPPAQPAPSPPSPPAAPASPSQRPYFFSANGKDSGPHSLEEMRRFRKSGRLTDETLVIREGDSNWLPATMFPEIYFEG
jgi:hypothetical protein